MPRLFTGIKIPPEIGAQLCRLQFGLEGARWIDAENFHITLRFVGDIDETTADDFAERLDEISARPFSLSLRSLGAFGNKNPRMVWAGVAPEPALDALHKAHEQAAQRAGLKPEGRKFTPHVTIARLRHGRAADVARYLSLNGDFSTPAFNVEAFSLFSARGSRGGGPYIVECDYLMG